MQERYNLYIVEREPYPRLEFFHFFKIKNGAYAVETILTNIYLFIYLISIDNKKFSRQANCAKIYTFQRCFNLQTT